MSKRGGGLKIMKEIKQKTVGKYGTTVIMKDKTVFHPRQFWFNRMIPFKKEGLTNVL